MNNPETLLETSHICLCLTGGDKIAIFYPLLVFHEVQRFGVLWGTKRTRDASKKGARLAPTAFGRS